MDTKANAVNKVTAVLEEMKAQLEKEAASDDEVYQQMMCWCETNDKLKTKAISDNTQLLGQLEEFIPEAAAKIAQLQTEVKILKGDIADGTQELAEATALREKEEAEFKSEEADTLVSISGVTKAIDALGAKMSSAFLEVQNVVDRRKFAQLKGVTPEQRERINDFLQTRNRAPSSEIFGILKSMKESFEINLKDSQDDEKAAVAAYADLKAGKDDEIAAATTQKNTKEAQAADTVEKLAQAKEDKVSTAETLKADEKFLADLKDRCGSFDADFAARKKMRSEEMAAVGEALSILTSDDAREQFSKSVAFTQVSMKKTSLRVAQPHYAGLLQAESKQMAQARTRASRLLLEQALALGSPRLSMIAQSVRADVFAKIKVAIDQMVAQLKQEQKDEVKHRDFCIAELNQNEKQTDEAYDTKKELTTKIDDLSLQIKNTDEEIANAKQEITDTQLQIKKASENREKENWDYQTTISDQKATQAILKKALDKLKAFYEKAALLQTRQEPPPEGFGGEYKKSGGASGVMMMIETIVEESVQTEADAAKAEQDAQTSYEKFVKDSNAAIETLNTGIAEKTSANADAKADLARTGADFKDTMSRFWSLANYAQELHTQCDFTLKQFDKRQAGRAKEIEALTEAKMILSGMEV